MFRKCIVSLSAAMAACSGPSSDVPIEREEALDSVQPALVSQATVCPDVEGKRFQADEFDALIDGFVSLGWSRDASTLLADAHCSVYEEYAVFNEGDRFFREFQPLTVNRTTRRLVERYPVLAAGLKVSLNPDAEAAGWTRLLERKPPEDVLKIQVAVLDAQYAVMVMGVREFDEHEWHASTAPDAMRASLALLAEEDALLADLIARGRDSAIAFYGLNRLYGWGQDRERFIQATDRMLDKLVRQPHLDETQMALRTDFLREHWARLLERAAQDPAFLEAVSSTAWDDFVALVSRREDILAATAGNDRLWDLLALPRGRQLIEVWGPNIPVVILFGDLSAEGLPARHHDEAIDFLLYGDQNAMSALLYGRASGNFLRFLDRRQISDQTRTAVLQIAGSQIDEEEILAGLGVSPDDEVDASLFYAQSARALDRFFADEINDLTDGDLQKLFGEREPAFVESIPFAGLVYRMARDETVTGADWLMDGLDVALIVATSGKGAAATGGQPQVPVVRPRPVMVRPPVATRPRLVFRSAPRASRAVRGTTASVRGVGSAVARAGLTQRLNAIARETIIDTSVNLAFERGMDVLTQGSDDQQSRAMNRIVTRRWAVFDPRVPRRSLAAPDLE